MSEVKYRVPYGDGESPASFCSRLAMESCCDSVFEFCRDKGLSFRDVVDGEPKTLAWLAVRGGGAPAALLDAAILRIGDGYRCAWQSLTRQMLRRNRVVICPACLAEDLAGNKRLGAAAAYGRTIWMLAPFRTCPVHSLSLVEVAGANSVKGQNGMAMLDFAQRVGTAIGDLDKWMARARPAAPSQLETYLLRRLRGLPGEGTGWLDGLPFHAVAQVCEMVGAVEIGGPNMAFGKLADDQRREAGGAGYRLLAPTPDGLRLLVDRLFREPSTSKGDVGPGTFLGQLYPWLRVHRDPCFEPLRDIVQEMTLDRLAMDPTETVFGQPVGERRLHSIQSASRQYRIHPKRLRKLLRQSGFLDAASDSRTDHLAVFPADDRAADFLSKVRDSMPLKEAGTYINAPRVQMRLLHDSGLITPLVRGRRGHEIKDHAYHREELDAFLRRLLADATDVGEGDKEFCNIPLAARRARCQAMDIVRLVLERKLTRVRRRPDVAGYMSVLVDPGEVRGLAEPEERPGLSLAEVVHGMGWSRPVAKALVDHGHLPSMVVTNQFTGMPQRVVQRADLEWFDGEYVSLFHLARQRSLHASVLMSDLRRRGVRPAFDVSEVPARFFRRAELPPA